MRASKTKILDQPSSAEWPVLANVSQLPFLSGNDVELLIDGDATFSSLLDGISRAEKTLFVQFYIIHDDELGQEFATRLIERADVLRFHVGMKDRPIMANRALALLSRMFSLAERWGLRPDGSNPRKPIKKHAQEKRERLLSPAELELLSRWIEQGLAWPEGATLVPKEPADYE